MSGPRIYSKDILKQYILRKLGGGLVNIEITDAQLDDLIYDVVDSFVLKAYSGIREVYLPFSAMKGIKEYQLPYSVFAVLGIYASAGGYIGGGTPSSNPFHINQYIASDIFQGRGVVNLIQYELTFQMINTLNLLLGKSVLYDYNTFSKLLTIFSGDFIDYGGPVLIHCYKTLHPQEGSILNPNYICGVDDPGLSTISGETTNIYDHIWIRKMTVEKARYQWAVNMMKYSGTVLPNGGSLNVDGILNEAKENITKLEEELDSTYQLPPDFMIG
jgi:hypothetical protein